MRPVTRRSVMAGSAAVVAAVPVAALAAVPAIGSVEQDAELRDLWAKYVKQFQILEKAGDAYMERRKPFEAERGEIYWGCAADPAWRKRSEILWKKHGLEPFSKASNREHRKCLRIVKAIRKVRAQSLFGIGVKLSAWEDRDSIGDEEFGEVIDSVRRDIAALIGFDFIEATHPIEA